MISAPSQPDGIQRDATRFVVLLGDDNGVRPDITDEVTWLEPIAVRSSAGAARVDSLTLRVNFPAAVAAGVIDQPILQDLDLAFDGSNRLAEIRATDDDGNFTRVLGWGKFGGDSLSLGPHQEATVACRLDHYLFGTPLEFFPLYSSATSSADVSSVSSGSAGNASFEISGNFHLTFIPGFVFTVNGSTANDGQYSVLTATYAGGSTTITVAQPVISDVADGELNWFPLSVSDRMIFNPLIDGRILGNMSSQQFSTPSGGLANYVIDPESLLTTNAQAQHPGETASLWDMASAVNFLCQFLNPNETYINNPDQGDVETLFESFDSSQLRNMSIPLGKYLPDSLDLLLKPYGYSWYLANSTDDDNPDGQSQSTITLFKRGTGTSEVQVYMDRVGDPISLQGTNVKTLKIERSLANTVNVIDGCSALGKFQCTLPLFPAWNPEYDSLRPETLAKDQLTALTHDIGRKWACNEAGDYTPAGGGSFGFSGIYIFTPDLSTAFGLASAQVKRRVLHHCLSLDGPVGQGHSLGIWVEWWNPDALLPNGTTGGAWEKIAEGHSVLKKECGIWFDGDFPPLQLWDYATKGPASWAPGFSSTPFPFGLRVTAVLEADLRTWSRGVRSAYSPNGANVCQPLDLSHKFPWRSLALDGDYASALPGTSSIAGITAGSAGSGQFQIAGNLTATFPTGTQFFVTGSPLNDGQYTVTSSSYDSGSQQTTLHVSQAVPSAASLDGSIVWNTDILDPLHPPSGVPITTYCQTLQNWQDAAQLSSSVVLDSASHAEYTIGQTISAVAGRNLKLNAKLPASAHDDPRHPQIMGINYLFDPQKTELVLETFKREEFPELEDKGEGRKSTAQTTVKGTGTKAKAI
jgi:hypothetical protein